MKYLKYYLPFFGFILAAIENEPEFFDLKNYHFYGTALFHGIIYGLTFAL